MTIKKLTFCILCFVNAANLATEEDFNAGNSSKSVVEENVLINKNNWNTRKWGNIYFLFPNSNPFAFIDMFFNLILAWYNYRPDLKVLFTSSLMALGGYLLFGLVAGLIEYKYWFNKKIGISFYTILSPFLIFDFKNTFNFSISINLFWCKKNKNIFESSIVLVHFNAPIEEKEKTDEEEKKTDEEEKKTDEEEKTLIYRFSSDFYLLKYEKDRKFYLIYGMFNINWGYLYNCKLSDFFLNFSYGFFSIIFGFNIIGVNDYRKKKEKGKKLLLIQELLKDVTENFSDVVKVSSK